MACIVMIDDEPWALRGIRDIIDWSSYGFDEVNAFDESSAAFDFVVSKNPEVVLTDVRMPEMTGLSLIQKCRERGVSSIFVIISAFADFSYAKQAMDEGVFSYILKPLKKEDIETLAGKLSAMIESRSDGGNEVRSMNVYTGSTGKVIDYVNAHFTEALSLQALSEKFNISLSHLSRSFKHFSGMSFTNYVARKRIDYACKLLLETDMSIAQIGQLVGYQDYFHFSKIFRKRMGKSPSEIRKGEHK